ncbi:hypothetical protein [Kribbella sp. NPDC048915]|uniref:hypothetical protein n=1 Tax=Kribbella sp. NPDC048915 TaxID=3155148 RepID=UPI0033D42CC2
MLLTFSVVTGCSEPEAVDPPSTGVPTPILTPQPALKAATDCAKSTVELPPEAEADGVQLTLSTDPSRSSLLLKNTGSLTVVVLPDARFTTRLIAAPHANPKDAASRAALIALNNSGTKIEDLPPYVPGSQVVALPPQWALCALTDSADEIATVRYLQDRQSSAEYLVTKALADQLLQTNSVARTQPTLIRCAKGMLDVLKANAGLPDIELYAGALRVGTPCRNGYRQLLRGDAQAAERLGATVLRELDRAPRLAPNSRLYTITTLP